MKRPSDAALSGIVFVIFAVGFLATYAALAYR